jgi:hypothetical protein
MVALRNFCLARLEASGNESLELGVCNVRREIQHQHACISYGNVYMSTITNIVTMQIFEVTRDKFNVYRIRI